MTQQSRSHLSSGAAQPGRVPSWPAAPTWSPGMTRSGSQRSANMGAERDAAPAPSPAPAAGKRRVLVVDDEQDLVELISYNLGRNGFDVLTATNGPDALALAEREVPDLVVLDLMLPGLDGMEVARRLKSG